MFESASYLFDLPESLIAQAPVEPRDHSRLMVIDRKKQSIEHRHFNDLPEYVDSGDLLISNNSKVIRARLLGNRVGTGGAIEVFLIEQAKEGSNVWKALYRGSKKASVGLEFEFKRDFGTLRAQMISTHELSSKGIVEVEFNESPIQKKWGEIPLPPYIDSDPKSESKYETIYAKTSGSVAAPTAGFHFTQDLLQKLQESHVGWEEVTLHVGLGTFRPIRAKDIRDHVMHGESYWVGERVSRSYEATRQKNRKVIAVGTTSFRTLESVVREHQTLIPKNGQTDLFVYPGQKIESVDALITNFHLPDSTLILLVSAFAGKELIRRAYQEAIEKQYRFYSFGDAMLIL